MPMLLPAQKPAVRINYFESKNVLVAINAKNDRKAFLKAKYCPRVAEIAFAVASSSE